MRSGEVKIIRVKVSKTFEPCEIKDREVLTFEANELEATQLADAPADVNGGHACCVGDIDLRHWKMKGVAVAKLRLTQLLEYFAKQMGYALDA